MDYGRLVREAWATTWRYRFLWVLGILAGGGVGVPALNGGSGGSNTGWRIDQAELERVSPRLAAAMRDVSDWSVANAGWLVLGVVVLVALLLVMLVLSLIAQGGMARATADLATGQPSSLGRAWSAGMHLFWRYLGLWLALIGASMLIAALVAITIALAVAAGGVSQTPAVTLGILALVAAMCVAGFAAVVAGLSDGTILPKWAVFAVAALFALPLFTVVIVVALALSIVIAFAQRAIAVENVGPIDALRSGWQLLRANVGESLLTWLINLGLAFATGLVVVAGVITAVAVLFTLGAALWASIGFSAPTIAYASLGLLAMVAVGLTLAGVANTFFWNYWTLAYLRLSGRLPAAA